MLAWVECSPSFFLFSFFHSLDLFFNDKPWLDPVYPCGRPEGAEGHYHKTTVDLEGKIQTQPLRKTSQTHTFHQHSSTLHDVNGHRPPPSALTDYLTLVMLCRSLCVCSERSEGTRISTELIFRTRPSTSERDGPSGKQSSNTSPVLG